ncbi:MAG: hypothetical protein CYPHOPRED_004112 [Cyphobasidiales sp. Tagirdzhanova-0007]|nr:MAG: hypothetical protein CYPHOPRED_004112 [Cyphobasidiales sp. Tagirdzhanova-0007]
MPSLELSYSSTPGWPFPASTSSPAIAKALRIAILDSSFNPPSRGHGAIAVHDADSYDAHLLLLSSVNVDKIPKKGETSLDERRDMMTLLAERMIRDVDGCRVVAAGTLAAATFAEKAPVVLAYLLSRHAGLGLRPTLVFFIGFDTVTRLFMKKYYQNSEDEMERVMSNFFERDGCEIICSRRALTDVAQNDVADEEEAELLTRPFVKRFADRGRLIFVDMSGTEGISSTKIRNAFRGGSTRQETEVMLQGLAHPEIVNYCLEKGLYRQKS